MGLIRTLPLPVRLPLIHAALATAWRLREPRWRGLQSSRQTGPLVVSGFLGEALGVGRAADATANALEAAGYAVERQSLRPAQTAIWAPGQKPRLTDRPGGVWLIHANAPETEVALMAHDAADWMSRYRIGYWAWETTLAPLAWARTARWLDEIWVTSHFTAGAIRNTLERAGMGDQASKLRVMPHPVTRPASVQADPTRFGLEPGIKHALVMFDGRSAFARKNPWGAIEAWTRAFPEPSADARLVLKVRALDADPAARRRLTALMAERPDLQLIETALSAAEVWDLLASVDLLISLHRAEGFGLIPAEAMALGKPVVMTGWSGVTDFADNDSAALIPFHLVAVDDPSGAYRTGQWAEPDLDIAAARIRELITDPEKAARLGARGPARIQALSKSWRPDILAAMPFTPFLDNSANRPAP